MAKERTTSDLFDAKEPIHSLGLGLDALGGRFVGSRPEREGGQGRVERELAPKGHARAVTHQDGLDFPFEGLKVSDHLARIEHQVLHRDLGHTGGLVHEEDKAHVRVRLLGLYPYDDAARADLADGVAGRTLDLVRLAVGRRTSVYVSGMSVLVGLKMRKFWSEFTINCVGFRKEEIT